jgi:hypothetical protein
MIYTHEQVTGGEEYLGFARQKLAWLERARLEAGAPIMTWGPIEINGVEIYIESSNSKNLIRIESIPGGFICHPRDLTNKGGAKPGGVAITPEYTYPLVDDDQGSRILTYEGDAWAVSSDVENYGNLYWISGGGDVLSWRGPAGRQFAMDSTKSYPGFTEWDYTEMVAGLEVEHYTPYRNQVYQNGEVLKEFLYGYKVLGCALNSGSLVCVIGVDYAGIANPDGGTGGFYDEVWIGDARIGWQSSSRPKTPWFFNSIGTEAVCGNRKIVVAEDLLSVVFSDLEVGSGSQNNEYTGADRSTWGVTKSGSWPMFRDYVGLMDQGVALIISLDERSTSTANGSEDRADLPVMMSGIDDPVVTVSGPEGYAGEGAYSYAVSGNNCGIDTVEWSYPNGCGEGTVSVTVTFLGGKTVTGSMQVKMPSGSYMLIESWYSGRPNSYLFTCGNTNGFEYTTGGYGFSFNAGSETGPQWNIISQTCITGTIPKDLGYPSDKKPIPCSGYEQPDQVSSDGHCYSVTLHQYVWMNYYTKYKWFCNDAILIDTTTIDGVTYYTYANP